MSVNRKPPRDTVQIPILVRAFSQAIDRHETARRPDAPRRQRNIRPQPSDVRLIFDCETTTDHRQQLRFGFYQLRVAGELDQEGAFYDALSAEELAVLVAYSTAHGLPSPIPVEEFRAEIFLKRAYACGAAIIGFNLPFDLSRIAMGVEPARVGRYRRKMKNAFSLRFSDRPWDPRVQIKHLNARAAVIEYTVPGAPQTSRSRRKRGDKTPPHRGHFCDVKTLAAAVTSKGHSLAGLSASLGVATPKGLSEEHGEQLTERYIDYGRRDVQATWECFEVLREKYESYGLSTPVWDILSEASIGKALLVEMGVRPWSEVQPDADPCLTGAMMSTYYGGRTEVRWRLVAKRVLHTDFLSMYPTVCTLMGLWRFIIGQGFTTRDSTAETRALLETITAEDLRDRNRWPGLTTLVRVRPSHDLLPIRAKYRAPENATIGLNYLTCEEPLWITLADAICAKLLGEKAPEIEEAITFTPNPPQRALRPVSLLGHHRIEPGEDVFRSLIQLRSKEAKTKRLASSDAERASIEERRQSLKIIANSSSYGIFVQMNVESERRGAEVTVYGPDGEPFDSRSTRIETPGPFFHPLLATLITGAGRLMLGLAEHQALANALDWALCDTDSLAIAKPDQMPDDEFVNRAKSVVEWFRVLNPYGDDASILQIEDINYHPERPGGLEPLYCLAVSSKRYVLFNRGADGLPIIRKASAHGLGYLLAPYGEEDAPPDIPAPLSTLRSGKDRLERWEYDLWFKIVEASDAGRLHQLKFGYHSGLHRPAVSRYAATSPELLRWFKTFNLGKPYADQVKPFGFMYALQPKRAPHPYSDEMALRGAPLPKELRPAAPFDLDLSRAIASAFDRETGEPVSASDLRSYAEALARYQLKPESKFANAEAFQTGRTERRHVIATEVQLIGKEADALEETYFLGLREDPTIRYGRAPRRERGLYTEVRKAAASFGVKAVADATSLTRAAVGKLRAGQNISTKVPHMRISAGLRELQRAKALEARERRKRLMEYSAAVSREGGIRPAARHLGLDPSNLAKLFARSRRPK